MKISKENRLVVFLKYGKCCAYCGEDLEYKKMQVDHIEPKHLGGKDEMENYNPSCRECNFYKSTYSIDKFKKQLSTITERIKKPFIVRLALKYGIISFKPFDGKFYFENPIINKKHEK
jgi:5-methylcytosine-specific restriction endonuclease McrA